MTAVAWFLVLVVGPVVGAHLYCTSQRRRGSAHERAEQAGAWLRVSTPPASRGRPAVAASGRPSPTPGREPIPVRVYDHERPGDAEDAQLARSSPGLALTLAQIRALPETEEPSR